MITRRNFLTATGVAATASVLSPLFTLAAGKKDVGLQLYSLRKEIPKDVKGVMAQVKQAGYTEVETYGFSIKDQFWGLKPAEMKQIFDDNGLKAPSGHYGLGSYLSDGKTEELEAAIAAAKVLGSEYVTIPWIDAKARQNADDYKKIGDKLNVAGKMCKDAGIRLSYHNHDFEFKKVDDTNGLDIMLKSSDKKLVDFELDLYWTIRAGADPLKLFKANPGRFTMWHVKDMDKTDPELNVTVGTGVIDFKPIFAAAKLSGMRHFYVEHENNYVPTAIGTLEASCKFIKSDLLK